MDFERDCDWELIVFGEKNKGYGDVRLIAHTDDLDKIKQLLTIYDINPNKYFKNDEKDFSNSECIGYCTCDV